MRPPFRSRILSVAELLSLENLAIPAYQRPYRWQVHNVEALFSDLLKHQQKSAYRLGTVVLHWDKDASSLFIVDGQQRTLTLLLTVKAMLEQMAGEVGEPALRRALETLRPHVGRLCGSLTFTSDDSRWNLRENHRAILRIVESPDFTPELALYLLNSCEVVVFVLDDIGEAFQFFDSQNSRGKDLSPHDLLKPYHIKAFASDEKEGETMAQAIAGWEALDDGQLDDFFGNYWFRIRSWSRGKSGREFLKKDVGLFKGVDLSGSSAHPHAKILEIAHRSTDQGEADGGFPFQMDQTILNGRRFFEMTSHYLGMVARYTSDHGLKKEGDTAGPAFPAGVLDERATEILRVLDGYTGRHRRGDRYVRNLFDCLLLFYIDRFGMDRISKAIEKIFLCSYRLRLSLERIQFASVDNLAISEPYFRVLRDAVGPEEFLLLPLLPLSHSAKPTKGIEDLFRTMKHLSA